MLFQIIVYFLLLKAAHLSRVRSAERFAIRLPRSWPTTASSGSSSRRWRSRPHRDAIKTSLSSPITKFRRPRSPAKISPFLPSPVSEFRPRSEWRLGAVWCVGRVPPSSFRDPNRKSQSAWPLRELEDLRRPSDVSRQPSKLRPFQTGFSKMLFFNEQFLL